MILWYKVSKIALKFTVICINSILQHSHNTTCSVHITFVSRSSSNTLFFPHHCECPSSLFIFCCSFSCSFYTLNQLTIQFFVLTPATVQRDELRNWVSKQSLCRTQTFTWCADLRHAYIFLQKFSRTWSQNIRNASFSLGCQCLREMHMHCKPTVLQNGIQELACTKRWTWCCSLVYQICAMCSSGARAEFVC